MSNFFGLFGDEEREEKRKNERKDEHNEEFADDAKLTLHAEELDIAKDRVKTGEVTLHKDIIEEHKMVEVPVSHDEVIIERRALSEDSDTPIDEEVTYHIPTSKEEVRVGKHTMITGEVEAHKKSYEETEEIDEILRKEEARVDVDGDARVISEDKDNSHH